MDTRTHRVVQFPRSDRLTEAEQIRFAEELQNAGYQPGIPELVADFFGTEFGSGIIWGFIVGAFFTLGSAIVWAWVAS